MSQQRSGVASKVGKDLAWLYILIACAVYLVLYWPLRDYLPEKFMRDANKITEIMQSSMNGSMEVKLDNTGSYTNTALILAAIPDSMTDIAINLVAIFATMFIVKDIRSWRGLMLMPIMLVPLWLTSLMATTKETVLVAITMGLLLVATHLKRPWLAIGIIVAAYVWYALNIRIYYSIIIALALFIAIVIRTPRQFRAYWLIPFIIASFFIPRPVFEALQMPRDNSYQWLAFGSQFQVRTLFANPYPPITLPNFLYNYFYAFALLNFPFWKFHTINEVILFVNVITWYSLTFIGLKYLRGPPFFLVCVFLGHLLVLPLFEPDLGSYLRHASSVIIYLVPALRLVERRRTERAQTELSPAMQSAAR